MTTQRNLEAGATVSVRNIGGIDETSVSLEPGVSILYGRNATNRTSFLQALMAALGSENISMKGDAEEAEVELEFNGDVYTRRLVRKNGSIVTNGEPYLDDPELADLFAFLLESNEARRTVASEGNLRDLIMRPIDLDEIKSQISEYERQKRELDEEIQAIEERKRDLPELEAEQARLENEIEETQAELAAKEEDIEAADAEIQAQRRDQQELEEKLQALRDARNDLEDVRYDLETERESIQSLKEDRTTVREELADLPETPDEEIAELNSQIEQLRERSRTLDSKLNSLQNTVNFNEEMLDSEQSDIYDAIDSDDSNVTDELLEDTDVVCWTCGSEVEREQIETTIEQLRSVRSETLSEKQEVSSQLEELKADKHSLDQQQRRREELERRLSQIEDEIEQSQDRVEDLQKRRETLEERVQSLESEIESLESDQFDEVLELHREANELEYELGRLENDLQSVNDEIGAIEERLEEQSELEEEREAVTENLTELRTRVERLEEDAVAEFNEHMDEVLGLLDYDNLDRIWLERVQREVREGRRKNIKTFFDLHVVRTTPSGATYEDTIDHLSESEREVTGLVFALAGYLSHEVYEQVPFILLDSLEAIDSERIANLVDYFADYADFLTVALLPEDAQALNKEYTRIDSI
jgi:chromosome segregation ATPase